MSWIWIFFFRSSDLKYIGTGFNFYYYNFIFIQQAFWTLVSLFMRKLSLFKMEILFGQVEDIWMVKMLRFPDFLILFVFPPPTKFWKNSGSIPRNACVAWET